MDINDFEQYNCWNHDFVVVVVMMQQTMSWNDKIIMIFLYYNGLLHCHD